MLPRTLECLEKPVASRCVKNGTRRLQGMLQLRLSRRCGCRSIIPGSLRLRESCLKPFTLRAGSLDLHGGAVDLFRVRSHRCVVLTQPGQRRARVAFGLLGLGARIGERLPQGVGHHDEFIATVGGSVSFGQELKSGSRGSRACSQRRACEHLTRPGDDGDRARVGDHLRRALPNCVEVVRDDDTRQKRPHTGGTGDNIWGGPQRTESRKILNRFRDLADDKIDHPAIGVTHSLGQRKAILEAVHQHTFGAGTEHGGDRGLIPGRDLNGVTDQAPNPGSFLSNQVS